MAKNILCASNKVVTIDEYVEHISRDVNLRDEDSLTESAMMLRSLANDRSLVVSELNRRLEDSLNKGGVASAQTLVLGKGAGFYVRANIWPAISDMTTGRTYQDQFAYNVAHDHNFSFLTATYLGPGYDTDLYEYDYEKVQGFIGEQVDLRFVEKIRFGAGSVMLYRESKDVHIQYPPQELTVTLNLMISPQSFKDQYHFDMTTRTIASAMDLQALERTSFVTIAGFAGNADTRQLLTDVAQKHPCRRTRLAAYEALARQHPAVAATVWGMACRDPATIISRTAEEKLKGSGN